MRMLAFEKPITDIPPCAVRRNHMGLSELFLIAVGLSMDAFAVSVCKGLSVSRVKWQHALCVGLYFGVFQAIMPLIGYFLGSRFQHLITNFDHWIALGLLLIIGINMLREAFGKEEKESSSFDFKTMITLAVATSIDALAVGVTFAFLDVSILPAVGFIGTITFALSCVGLFVGNIFGSRYKKGAEISGGVILILMGIKILLEHLGVISF